MSINESEQLNVLSETLKSCSDNPKTGFLRDGCCNYHDSDIGMHFICVEVTEEFLAFSKQVGNDLSTPVEQFDFPGLKPGDKWCLCANRWLEAYEAKSAPLILAKATHKRALEIISMEQIKEYAIDIS